MNKQITQIGILSLVLIVGLIGLYQSTIGAPSGASVVQDYKTCCCKIVPLQNDLPVYEQTVSRQIEARGKDCNSICEYYEKEGWTYGKEGYCPKLR